MKKFPFYRQLYQMDCGPTCLMMVAKFYGKTLQLAKLREQTENTRAGSTLMGLSAAAELNGLKTLSIQIPFEKFKEHVPLPAIVYWKKRHFLVVYEITRKDVLVADPAHGLLKYSHDEFRKGWLNVQSSHGPTGVVLVIEPTPEFYTTPDEKLDKGTWTFVFRYLKPYKKHIFQLILGMILGSLLMLVLPFLTQAIVDVGINTNNLEFIHLMLFAQLMLTLSRTSVEFIRGWILLFISARVNIFILYDLLVKLMKLPMSFFDTKKSGDILQRMGDQKRIETFLSSYSLTFIFSLVNLAVFSAILVYYNKTIFAVFFIGSVASLSWVFMFLKKRKDLDYRLFDQMSSSQTSLIQLITGIQEIKLHNSEKTKRWEWERIQAQQFKSTQRALALSQYEQVGSVFINELKNILVTYLTAKAVMQGDISFGVMLAIQYIIGQLNAPVNQMVTFIHSIQEAKISLERLNDIHQLKDEEQDDASKTSDLPVNRTITFEKVSFSYVGGTKVLDGINLTIPENKKTAIVGASGSGKTTLIKLLLRFYEPQEGSIRIGQNKLGGLNLRRWRDFCGSVLQDGFIFSDTISRNIVVSDEFIDRKRMKYASDIANISGFIESLPLGFQTIIGPDGQGLSQGQKQRILIARAVYKDPELIFLDEATNALDTLNERVIVENLNGFLKGKTVVVVAHRLSTVMNADVIVVMDKGKIVEQGTHEELSRSRGHYFELIRNQLELGEG
ncbi:peptidase domain-containing ABC transporter [Algoriphagus terrigena]|uniref:peptidase domain-containing ABC transporter n=1 Tax=Algoriphagus terrigena TaxID=344884 RepID=UPI000478B0B0|nr:peptidase domain-containing ABC transporter [Algoriphagus terrigena]